MSTDMRLDLDDQLVAQANGDTALIHGDACFLQTLKLEAAASEGDLWYDPAWGWSLLDFKDAAQDELVTLEIEQRVRQKLEAHAEISVDSIEVSMLWDDAAASVAVSFRLLSDDEIKRLNVHIGRTEIEVIDLA